MLIAPIVPPSVANNPHVKAAMQRYHLLLPALVPDNDYREAYRGDVGYKIMDNGIAEGSRVDFQHQRYQATVLGCTTMVLPDVMHNMDATLDAVAATFYEAFQWRARFAYMLVAQGASVHECISTVDRALNMFPGIVDIIGIPRHILGFGPEARLKVADGVRTLTDKPIHLLGTYPDFPGELFFLRNSYRQLHIRGVDTSLAWNAARCGIPLKDPQGLSYNINIARQAIDEFRKANPKPKEIDLLVKNMQTLNRWVA